MNTQGTPCTLGHIDRVPVPHLPDPEPTTHKFAAEIQQYMAEVKASLNAIAAQLAEGAIGKTKAAELSKAISHQAYRLTGNTKFVADQFDEHMETTVEKAKIEVNAYVTQAVQRAGLQSIAQANLLTYGGQDGEVGA